LHAPKVGFYLQGWAEDAMEVLQKGRVCLAPLRFGAGIKTKLVDAMMVGTPSVTTSVGAESMYEALPWCGVIADNVDALVMAAVDLYRDEALWEDAQRHCFRLAEGFDDKAWRTDFVQHIALAYQNREAHRERGFTGRMLRYHHQRSTEFMSRWIVEKNRGE
ncbi:MAG: glycosyltransferase family 4 protein, partial [Zetaproteobacteria bacterium]|nr:glycosyltransferase family 4 protein [Zetaproteobacteria bacterium]